MSRENFSLRLNTSADSTVHVFVSHIMYMHYNKKEEKTFIMLSNGDAIQVTQTPEAIHRMGEGYGVIRELKQ